MEDIVDTLLQYAEDVPVPLDEADIEDIVDAEAQILLPLPSSYKHFLLQVGHVVYGVVEPATVADPGSHTYLPELTANAWDLGMDRQWAAICQIPDGYYAISPEGKIHLWHYNGSSEETHEDIWAWAQEIWLES